MGNGSLKWSEEDLAAYQARVANGTAPPAPALDRILLPAGQGTQGTIAFTVGGVPVSKLRARVFKDKSTGKMRAATPKKTELFSKVVALHAQRAMRYRAMLTGPLEIELLFYLPVPASWPKQKQADAIAGRIRPTSRPDWDNFGKLVSDACNKIVYEDDGQIVDAIVRKYYAVQPRVQVIIGRAAPHGSDI